jgi:hypothetical protein
MKRFHAITLAAALGCLMFTTGRAHAGIYTVSVPAFEGVRYTYDDPSLAAIVDFGQPFSQIDRVTVSVTATGHTGAGLATVWDFMGGYEIIGVTLDAEFFVTTTTEYWDGGKSSFALFADLGVFDETTPMTIESTATRNLNTFRDGKAEFNINTNALVFIGGGTLFPYDPAYVDIQSFTITVEGEPFTLVSDPTNDGFVGIEDLNLVLGGWGQTVAPGDIQAGDLDGDGFVGIKDLNQVLGNWNAGTPPAAATPVPEPATATALALLAAASLHLRRRM